MRGLFRSDARRTPVVERAEKQNDCRMMDFRTSAFDLFPIARQKIKSLYRAAEALQCSERVAGYARSIKTWADIIDLPDEAFGNPSDRDTVGVERLALRMDAEQFAHLVPGFGIVAYERRVSSGALCPILSHLDPEQCFSKDGTLVDEWAAKYEKWARLFTCEHCQWIAALLSECLVSHTSGRHSQKVILRLAEYWSKRAGGLKTPLCSPELERRTKRVRRATSIR